MNEAGLLTQGNLYLLSCEAIVWRMITRKSLWDTDTGELLPEAYIRRPPTDEKDGDADGISVMTKDHGDIDSFEKAAGLKRTGGVVSLHTGRVRTLKLDIIGDSPEHANIHNVPFYYEQDKNLERKAQVERLSGQLAAMSRPRKKLK